MPDLYHAEPNVGFLKPLIALYEKAADFTSYYFHPAAFEQFAPEFPKNAESRLSPEREGPILVDDGTVMSHSFFILEYIADALPGPALSPDDAYGRYRVQAWGQYVSQQIAPYVSVLGCVRYLAPDLKARDRSAVDAQIARIEPAERRAGWEAILNDDYDDAALVRFRERLKAPVGRIEDTLANQTWLAGDDYSIADIDAFAMLRPLPDLAPDVAGPDATPNIAAFLERMENRPAVREALAMSRTGTPETSFVPGPEPSRWG